MSRTKKDKPFKVLNKYKTRWNDCHKHGKLCSFNWRVNKDKILKRKKQLSSSSYECESYLIDFGNDDWIEITDIDGTFGIRTSLHDPNQSSSYKDAIDTLESFILNYCYSGGDYKSIVFKDSIYRTLETISDKYCE